VKDGKKEKMGINTEDTENNGCTEFTESKRSGETPAGIVGGEMAAAGKFDGDGLSGCEGHVLFRSGKLRGGYTPRRDEKSA
jgi:hypothetical protein